MQLIMLFTIQFRYLAVVLIDMKADGVLFGYSREDLGYPAFNSVTG